MTLSMTTSVEWELIDAVQRTKTTAPNEINEKTTRWN